ncbi:MAG: DUF1853 family protein [Allomuricauda sp.]|nr:MAG: DUF1853 family protein [Allomuricauda sp.]
MQKLIEGFGNTPPLWKNEQFGLQQFQQPVYHGFTYVPFDIPARLRLGHQMEYVFKQLLVLSQQYELHGSNLLIEEGKTRIGELDFIVKELSSNRYVHVELAYKFYIIDPEISEPIYRLVGPNRRDMFFTKLDKLKTKHLPLLYHESLNDFWANLKIDPVEIQQECCFKAQLFAPYDSIPSIRPLNTACLIGKWIRFDEFNNLGFQKAHFYLPKKQEWVIEPHPKVKWLTHFETLMEVNLQMVKENAPMLWMQKPSGEIEKLFVVWW